MVKIIATQRIPYGKRRYEAGEEIDCASEKDARLLVGIGKAKFAGAGSPTDLPARAKPADDIASLRQAYETVVGKRPFTGWTAQELRGRMTAHRNGQAYLRRDMRAKP